MRFNKEDFNWKFFNRRPFWISLVGGFMMAMIQNTGIGGDINVFENNTAQQYIQNASDKFESEVAPLLEKTQNSFKLKKPFAQSAPQVYADNGVNARAYSVVNLETGDIIKEYNGDLRTSIASITKVMTAVVALDLARPDEEFTVTRHASEIIPTKIGVIEGQKLRLDELLAAAMLTSANDAVEVIREGIDKKYGEPVFIDAMNRKAKFLGLNKTSFTNPQGFDHDNHKSSANDLAILTHYSLTHYPLIKDLSKKDYEYLPSNENHKQFDLYNWNGLIGVYPNVTGLKIGNTENAGKTTVVVSERGGHNIAVILLGAPGILERDLWAAQLLDEGFADVADLEPIGVNEARLQEKYASWEFWN